MFLRCSIIFVLIAETLASLKIEKEIKVALDVKDVKSSPYYKDKVLQLPISQEAGKELMKHWTDQAFSGLISAVATRRLKLVEIHDKEKHEKCAAEAHDIKSHAKCLIELETDGVRNRLLKRKKVLDKKTRKTVSKKPKNKISRRQEKLKKLKSLESYEASKRSSTSKSSEKKSRRRRILKSSKQISTETNDDGQQWVGSFRRAKREIKIKHATSYSIKTNDDMTPFSLITKQLTNTWKKLNKKDKINKWQDTIKRIRDESILMKNRKKVEELQRKRIKVFEGAKRIGKGREIRRKPVDRMTKNLQSMEKFIEDEELREMFHQKTSNMTEEEKLMMIPVDLIRQATKIGLSLGGHNTSDFDRKTLKMISPRFMSVLPEDEEEKKQEVDILSPSLFSLHDSGSDLEKQLSLSSLLGSKMSTEDSQNLLDLLVDVTGMSGAVEDAEKKLLETQRLKDDAMGRGPDGQPLYFTKKNVTERFPDEAKKIEVFEKLDTLYTEQQLKELNQTGYTILTKQQMELMYDDNSPFKNPKLLRTYNNMTKTQINRAIHKTIRDVADDKFRFEVRQKDIVLSPTTPEAANEKPQNRHKRDIILSPIVNTAIINDPATASQALILSPAVMVPLIQSPAIFGSVILSPWLFVPVILSPRILSPVILDPFMFVPIILSPLALVPVILSPGIFNPFVLSPLLLSPFILSPQVMTPLILSPFALTPLILNPLALSPLVLSPFVLSPQVLSPQYITGIILSPYALSPAIESNGKMVTVFGSPSWLS